MKINYIAFIAAVSLLISCKKEAQVIKNDKLDVRQHTIIDSTVPSEAQNDGRVDLKQLIVMFTERKEFIKLLLTQSTREEADSIYDMYAEENMLLLSRMYRTEDNMLEHFYDYFYDGQKKVTPPDSIQGKVVMLKNVGLDLCEQGEGYVDICVPHDYYYNIFKLYVTPDYKEFIRINAEEDKEFYAIDAGLHVTFEQVSERVLNWENFALKYPKTKLKDKVKDLTDHIRRIIFLGWTTLHLWIVLQVNLKKKI